MKNFSSSTSLGPETVLDICEKKIAEILKIRADAKAAALQFENAEGERLRKKLWYQFFGRKMTNLEIFSEYYSGLMFFRLPEQYRCLPGPDYAGSLLLALQETVRLALIAKENGTLVTLNSNLFQELQ